ncbi:MAG TPA: hypothetical protein VFA94_17075 [Acidimicrobiales bacterium]|nr:hypothetical protein [Acidimicrobiales bacterium]
MGRRAPTPAVPGRRRTVGPGFQFALVAVLPLLSALSALGTALSPHLLHAHPLLLVALAPRCPFLIAAAHHTSPGAFALVAFARLTAADAPNFLLARHHGPRIHDLASRWALSRAVDRTLARLFHRFGLVLVACSPTGKVLALAGMSDLSARRVATADAAGTLVQLAALYGLGRLSPVWLLAVVTTVIAAGLAGLAVLGAARLYSRGRRTHRLTACSVRRSSRTVRIAAHSAMALGVGSAARRLLVHSGAAHGCSRQTSPDVHPAAVPALPARQLGVVC